MSIGVATLTRRRWTPNPYALEGVVPPLVLDFKNGRYYYNGVRTSLENCLTSTGSSPTTVIDADGKLKWAAHNLLAYSNDFTQSVWVQAGTPTIASTGVNGPLGKPAWSITDDSTTAWEGIHQSFPVAADNAEYTVGLFVQKTSGGTSPTFGFNIYIQGGTTVSTLPRINLDSGAVLAGANTTVTDRGDFWEIKTTIQNNGTNTTFNVYFYPATGPHNSSSDDTTATGTAVVSCARVYRSDLGGMQLTSDGSDYVETGSTAVYWTGMDFSSGTRRMQVWEGRTNLVLDSNDFTTANWVKTSSLTITGGSTTGVDGQTSGTKLSATADWSQLYQGASLTAGTTYVMSAWYKNISAVNPRQVVYDAVGGSTIVSNYFISEINTTGWTRVDTVFTPTNTGTHYVYFSRDLNNNEEMYIYGAQLEAGSVPSPYIPTTSAAVSRAAHVVKGVQSGSLPFAGYDQTQGTFVVDFVSPGSQGDKAGVVFTTNTTTYNNSIALWAKVNSSNSAAGDYLNASTYDGATTLLNLDAVKGTDGNSHRVAIARTASDFASSDDGDAAISGTGRNPSPTYLHIGNRDGDFHLDSTISYLAYYPARISDATLQTESAK